MKDRQRLMRLAHQIVMDEDWKALNSFINTYYFNRWRTCEDEYDREEIWYEYQGFMRFSKRLEAMNFTLNQDTKKPEEAR